MQAIDPARIRSTGGGPPLGPVPLGALTTEPMLLLYADAPEDETPPASEIDEVLALRCASL